MTQRVRATPAARGEPGADVVRRQSGRRAAVSPSGPVATSDLVSGVPEGGRERHQRQDVPDHRGGDEEGPHAARLAVLATMR